VQLFGQRLALPLLSKAGRVIGSVKVEVRVAVALGALWDAFCRDQPAEGARLAALMRERRFELLALLAFEIGKDWYEADAEIAEARWFAADALPPLPPSVSIARRLIDETARRLAES
jgi:hypothetical protein